jgi:hypothetical protein
LGNEEGVYLSILYIWEVVYRRFLVLEREREGGRRGLGNRKIKIMIS